MKKQIYTVLATALVTSISFAQDSSSTTAIQSSGVMSSQGVRISLLKPFLDAKLKVKVGSSTGEATDKIDNTLGVAVGYAHLPVENVGATFNLAYYDMKDGSSTTGMLRLDGNIAYAFTQIINLKGGLNVSKFTSGNGVSDFNPGLGLQASLGIQATKNVGVDIGYVFLSQTGKVSGFDVELQESGLELGLNGTF